MASNGLIEHPAESDTVDYSGLDAEATVAGHARVLPLQARMPMQATLLHVQLQLRSGYR